MKSVTKKLFGTLLGLVLSVNVSAYDFEVDGVYYEVVSFSELTCSVVKGDVEYNGDIVIPATVNYNNRTLTVVKFANKLFSYNRDLTGITIPNTISSIGNDMFNGCSKLERVTIEDGATTLKFGYSYSAYSGNHNLFLDCPLTTLYIGRNFSQYTPSGVMSNYSYYAPFANNTSLKEVTIGDMVTSIGYYTFYKCTGLESLTIGRSLTFIDNQAFYDCKNLISVHIPDLATWCNIQYAAWAHPFNSSSSGHLYLNGEEIRHFVIPASITSINSQTFCGCSGLEHITIPNSVTSIGSRAFEGCTSLLEVTIPSSVNNIDGGAFSSCKSVTEITIEDGETPLSLKCNYSSGRTSWLGEGLFYDCPITTLYIGRNLSYSTNMSDGYSPFYGVKTIKEVVLSNQVSQIGKYAFGQCESLTSVTIPNTITSIDDYMFYGCSSLASITIPESVASIGNSVFSGCTGLTSLYSLNITPPSIGADNFSNSHYMNLNVYVPQEALTAYQNAAIWKDLWNLQGFEYAGINNVKVESNNIYYDLKGNCLNAPKRGINIVNGKKIIIK